MIHFSLHCSNDHGFDAWFQSGAAFDAQAAAGQIECPRCGDQRIEKSPMAPGLVSGSTGDDAPAPDPDLSRQPASSRAEDVARQVLDAFETLRAEVVNNSENVGRQFSEEARRMHYGEVASRSIYGEATDQEAAELTDEGVEFQRIPLPARKNS